MDPFKSVPITMKLKPLVKREFKKKAKELGMVNQNGTGDLTRYLTTAGIAYMSTTKDRVDYWLPERFMSQLLQNQKL